VPPEPFSRRSFLALAGGAVVLAACGGDDDSASSRPNTTTTSSPGAESRLTPGVVTSDLYASPEPQRLAFIVQTQQAEAASIDPATIAIAPPDGELGPFVDAPLHTDGLPDKRGVYVVTPTLTAAGIYNAKIRTAGETLDLPFQVQEQASAPATGTKAPTAASATTADRMGVNPICTRDPVCPLHEQSLADVVGKGRPVLAMFATPALCQTRFCGPVLDQMLTFHDEFRDRVDFVHVEIYQDTTGQEVVSTVEEWGLPSEPWIFAIDPAGTITGRLDGAFASDEIEALLTQLTS
jgi:hypothetical protein